MLLEYLDVYCEEFFTLQIIEIFPEVAPSSVDRGLLRVRGRLGFRSRGRDVKPQVVEGEFLGIRELIRIFFDS